MPRTMRRATSGGSSMMMVKRSNACDPSVPEMKRPICSKYAAAYFEQIGRFISGTLGSQALRRLTTIIDDPPEVARRLVRGMDAVREFRRQHSDSYNFNWLLSIQPQFQQPFEVTHAAMRSLELKREQPAHELAANLRRAFSGVVTGNVKEYGIQAIEREGPYELAGDPAIMLLLDELLAAFVAQRRMRLPGSTYRPVYRLVRAARESHAPLRAEIG